MKNSILRVAAATVVGILAAGQAFAASDATSSGAVANQAVTAVAAPIAATQTAGLIGGAVGNAIGGALGGGSFGGAAGKTGYNTRSSGAAGGGSTPKAGVWLQGTGTSLHQNEVALGMNGNIVNVVTGADYKFTDRLLLGLAFGWENTDLTTGFNQGTYKGNGYTLSPYMGFNLTPNWTWDLAGGYTWLSYDVTRASGSVSGAFDAGRWFTATNFTGAYSHDAWRFAPKVGVLYLKEDQDSYREAGGSNLLQSANTTILGRASGGGKVGYAFGGIVPYVKLMGEWDFKHPGAILKSNGQMSEQHDGGGVAGVGVDFSSGPFSGALEGSYNSIGRGHLDVWQGTANIRYQF